MRGYYPSYALKMMEKEGVVLDATDEDLEMLKNTCDFLWFSYYMSKCIASNPEQYEKGKGNVTCGSILLHGEGVMGMVMRFQRGMGV